MADTFSDDIANEYDLGMQMGEVDAMGHRIWRNLNYVQYDGWRPLTMDLITPPDAGRPHPLVIWVHGGGWVIGHPQISNPVLRKMRIVESLVAAGYAVARISYRLANEAQFPAQVHDCKAAVRYLRHHADHFGLDADRFAAMGESAGGHLALMMGMDVHEGSLGVTGVSGAVQALVNWYGVTDFTTMQSQMGDAPDRDHNAEDSPATRMIGVGFADGADAWIDASPVTHVCATTPPCLTVHGDKDRIVPVDQGQQFHKAMQDAGVRSEIEIVKGADHCWWGVDTGPIMPRVIAFLDSALTA